MEDKPIIKRLKSLEHRFGIPPFTIMDARQGYWQGRKRLWMDLGIQSEIGREDKADTLKKALPKGKALSADKMTGTQLSSGISIFDPVLCELAYRWFCPEGGKVLDIFAGGSVRGIVASLIGLPYTGIDLRGVQVKANAEQAKVICADHPMPEWIEGDARDCGALNRQFDYLFTCPPYGDLEVYSNDARDLSNMTYEQFRVGYAHAVKDSVKLLKPDRFACIVVGDFRDKQGFYRNFVSHTIEAYQNAGMHLYNEAILLTVAGSLPLRVGQQFDAGRKLGKTHQNVLVFYKGDPKNISKNFKPCLFGDSSLGSVLVGSGKTRKKSRFFV